MEFITIGKITISAHIVLVTASIALSLLLSYINGMRKRIFDIISNGLFIWFISWKLSYIVIEPKLAFANPVSILYFSGGTTGVILGLIIMVLYFILKIYRETFISTDVQRYFAMAWIYFWAGYFLLNALLINGTLNEMIIFLLLYVMIVWWQWAGVSLVKFLSITFVFILIILMQYEHKFLQVLMLGIGVVPLLIKGKKGRS